MMDSIHLRNSAAVRCHSLVLYCVSVYVVDDDALQCGAVEVWCGDGSKMKWEWIMWILSNTTFIFQIFIECVGLMIMCWWYGDVYYGMVWLWYMHKLKHMISVVLSERNWTWWMYRSCYVTMLQLFTNKRAHVENSLPVMYLCFPYVLCTRSLSEFIWISDEINVHI